MKYIKLFESMSEIEVEIECQRYRIKNWTLRPDGLVDVDGNVDLIQKKLTQLPLQFGRVTGNFDCSFNELTTLEGAPTEVDGNFVCAFNHLISLKGSPTSVGGDFFCIHNQLTTLVGAPREVGGDFWCYNNSLITLKGAPEYIEGAVDFLPNYYLPKYLLTFINKNYRKPAIQKYIFKWQKDYAVWRRDGSFNQANFIQMMEEAQDELENIKFPK